MVIREAGYPTVARVAGSSAIDCSRCSGISNSDHIVLAVLWWRIFLLQSLPDISPFFHSLFPTLYRFLLPQLRLTQPLKNSLDLLLHLHYALGLSPAPVQLILHHLNETLSCLVRPILVEKMVEINE